AQLEDCEVCRSRETECHCGGRLLSFPDRPGEPDFMGEVRADIAIARSGYSLDTLRRVIGGTEPPAVLWRQPDTEPEK
ncbi:MAG: hypothetical protein HN348_16455, partial [Proteobacteria bacterium]|nr:hypothetical protein [Pseudomonadota bacterium]